MIRRLKTPAESTEIRLPIRAKDFSDYGDRIISQLKILFGDGQVKGASLEEPNYEGIRVNFRTPSVNGWMLLRKSLHDPIMPLNIESDDEGGVEEIRKVLRPLLTCWEDLDTGKL